MKRTVGEKLTLREISPKGRFEIYEENFPGADRGEPGVSGRFIEVQVIRNFRIIETKNFAVEELD